MFKMISSVLLFLLPFSSALGNTLPDDFFPDAAITLSPDFTYQKEKFIGIDAGYGLLENKQPLAILFKIGAEKSLESSLIGIRLGTEISARLGESKDFPYLFLGADIERYSGYGEKELRFVPKIGIGWRSYISLTYKYGLHISGDKISNVGNHGISLGVNIPFTSPF